LQSKDAAYIVHAANAYPKLVAALRSFIGFHDACGMTSYADDARSLLRELNEWDAAASVTGTDGLSTHEAPSSEQTVVVPRDVIDRALEYFELREDVADRSDGTVQANEEMGLAQDLRDAIGEKRS
jgi:hypothetical protein